MRLYLMENRDGAKEFGHKGSRQGKISDFQRKIMGNFSSSLDS